jgi:hypothetical protein
MKCKKANIKYGVFIVTIIFLSTTLFSTATASSDTDIDPLVDLSVTFSLEKIRSLEKDDNHVNFKEYIDKHSDPDFFVKVYINNEVKKSKIWFNTKYVYDPDFSFTVDVPDDEELVDIKIELWDWNLGMNQLCDISPDSSYFKDSYDVELTYSTKYGHWWGDDHSEYSDVSIPTDLSGYGRLNGCDDGSIYQHERDCELWFNIYQPDSDGDGIPYWVEENVFFTDPTVDDRGRDDDNDLVPYEWEYKWGHYVWEDWHGEIYHYWLFNPFEAENHSEMDPDEDGLDNYEEYRTSQWGSDPFRPDLFVELDEMEKTKFPEKSKELLRTVYNRRNLVYHLDDGCMGGHDIIPFDKLSTFDEVRSMYNDYFLHGDENNWRRGVFHYGLLTYDVDSSAPGYCFRHDAYQISKVGMEFYSLFPHMPRDIVYASCYMHECGHTLGIHHGNTPGCDDSQSGFLFGKNWLKYRPYKSVMNYGYIYRMLDYSDGCRGKNDFDDWNRLSLTHFET